MSNPETPEKKEKPKKLSPEGGGGVKKLPPEGGGGMKKLLTTSSGMLKSLLTLSSGGLKKLLTLLKSGRLKKLLIVGGGGCLVLALLGGGGFYGWKKWQAYRAAKAAAVIAPVVQPVQPNTDDEEDPPPSVGEEGAVPPSVLIYKNNVNLEGKKNTYLVVEFNILFRDQELGKLVTSEKPTPENSIMRSIILEAISGKTLEEASDLEGREIIRQDILDRLNEKFAPKPLKPGEKEDAKHKKPKKPVKDVLVVAWAIAQ